MRTFRLTDYEAPHLADGEGEVTTFQVVNTESRDVVQLLNDLVENSGLNVELEEVTE